MMWIESKDSLPDEMEVVIGLFSGHWPGRGTGGIADVYRAGKAWFNIPEGVEINAWMPIPDTHGLSEFSAAPAAQGQSAAPPREWTTVDISQQGKLECTFDGDYCEIKYGRTS